MKQAILTSLLLFPFMCLAQNWQPILENEKHHFQNMDSSIISHSIYIDSIKQLGGESVYFLNRIVMECDSCMNQSGYYYYNFDRGQFLQQKMTKQSDGRFHFEGEEEFILDVHAELGDSWSFNGSGSTATVSDKSYQAVLGNMDSVKTIQVDGAYEIKISKTHGLLFFTDFNGASYEVKGLDLAGLGESVADYADLFNFEIGDVFQYYRRGNLDPGTPQYWDEVEKRTILNKEVFADSINYEVHRIGYMTYNWDMAPPFISPFSETTTITYKNNPDDWYNGYPQSRGFSTRPVDFSCDDQQTLSSGTISYYLDNDQRRCKVLGLYQHYGGMFCPDDQSPGLGTPYGDSHWQIYKEGLGLVEYDFFFFEVNELERLTAYVKNGDTTGVIFSDEMLVALEDPMGIVGVSVFPNPANEFITLNIERPIESDVHYKIFSSTAILQQEGKILAGQNQEQINLSRLSPGVFFIQLQDGQRSDQIRFVKLRP